MPTQHVSRPRRVVRNSRILDGEPTLEGTRDPVRTIVEATRYIGPVDEIVRAYPMLDHVSVAIALDFYEQHRDEIDRHIGANAD